jgi:hypothetical protein
MAGEQGTKFQINYKLPDGTLINIYANSSAELESSLTTLQDTVSLIASTSGALANSVARIAPAQTAPSAIAYAKTALGAVPVGASNGNNCKHGDLVWRESKPGAPKPWKGWFCPSPKGTADQCEPKFVR